MQVSYISVFIFKYTVTVSVTTARAAMSEDLLKIEYKTCCTNIFVTNVF